MAGSPYTRPKHHAFVPFILILKPVWHIRISAKASWVYSLYLYAKSYRYPWSDTCHNDGRIKTLVLHQRLGDDAMKILLADDHPLFREGVKQVLCQLGEQTTIVDAHDYPSLFVQARINPDLDLALIDLNMPGLPGHQGIRQFRHRFPDVPLVILSASESLQDMEQSLNAGALGYVLKTSPSSVILHALQRVLSGGIFVPDPCNETGTGARLQCAPSAPRPDVTLTTRQMEVLRGLLQGLPNKSIARRLELTEGTVKIHVAAIFRALDVNNRTEAVIAARQFGLDADLSKIGS